MGDRIIVTDEEDSEPLPQVVLVAPDAKPKSYRDLIGNTCSNCGHIFSEDDVKKATREFTTALAKDAFHRSKR